MELWQVLSAALMVVCVSFTLVGVMRLPNSRLSRPLVAFTLAGALWATGELMNISPKNMFWEQVGVSVLYSGSIFVAPLWWILSVRWAERHRVSHPILERWSWCPLAFGALMWLVMITNPWHGRFLTPVIAERNVYGPLFWVMAIPNYALILGAGALVATVLVRNPVRSVRRQGTALLTASAITLTAGWVYVSGINPPLNITVFVLAVSGTIVVLSMYREGLFGVLPVALAAVAERDADGLVIVRSGGRVAWVNRRARELLPTDLAEDARFPGGLCDALCGIDARPLRETGRTEGAWWRDVLAPEGQLYRLGENGEQWLRIRGQVIRGRDRRVSALSVRVRDVSAEREMESDLRRANRLESVAELSRGVAHDFRNLLSVIRGNADLLASTLPEDPSAQKKLARIIQAGDLAGEMAEQLQLYAGGVDPRLAPVDLSEIAREIGELQSTSLPRNQFLRLSLGDAPLVVEADATQLRQAVLNLLVNASEALGRQGGGILLETGRAHVDPAHLPHLVLGRDLPAGEYARLCVVDDGPGIDAAAQERIFEPFFSTKGKRGGIGLSSVLGIARAHGALLQLESQPGIGSAFALYFPIQDD